MYDVIIIGAGSSGLLAALLLSQTGKKVLVIEKNARSGKKLALCGGGNCNLGPVERESEALYQKYARFSPHPKNGHIRQESVRALKNLFYAYPPSLVEALISSTDIIAGSFHGLGIELREEEGRLYPARLDARAFADELCSRSEKEGAAFRYSSAVTSVTKNQEGGYMVHFSDAKGGENTVVTAPFVIIAAGGFSYPAVGGSDCGNGFLSGMGIAVHQGQPAMGPVQVKDYPFTASSGTVIPARINLVSGLTGATLAASGTDQLLFTHRNLSGPVILDICASVHECAPEKPVLVIDLLPALNREELLASMHKVALEHQGKLSVQLLSSFFPRVLSSTLLEMADIDPKSLTAVVPKGAMQKAAALVKGLKLTPVIPTSRHEAMSWTGGCEISEIDFTTMEAKKAPGLFVTGDMVAMSRPCGGYSLWFCWTSAIAAAIKIDNY